MINKKDNPVEWALMSYEFEEVVEHLQEISTQMISNASIDETDFEVCMGHIYAHLNRIWNSRNHIGDVSEEERNQYTKFPVDIELRG